MYKKDQDVVESFRVLYRRLSVECFVYVGLKLWFMLYFISDVIDTLPGVGSRVKDKNCAVSSDFKRSRVWTDINQAAMQFIVVKLADPVSCTLWKFDWSIL